MEAVPFNHAAALAACARGDEAAFHRLFDHEAPRMLALCQRLVPTDAESVLHDAFALIWRNADQYDETMGRARAWIYCVLRHVARHHRLRQNVVPPVLAPSLPGPPQTGGKLAALAANEPLAYQVIAHGYLDGADYRRVSSWLSRRESDLRDAIRDAFIEVSA